MSIISRLAVVLGLDSAEFNSGLGKAEGSLVKFGDTAKAIGVGAVAALSTAMIAGAKEALQFANDMTELAQANDMTVKSVLEMSSALSTSGGKIDNTSKILSAFTNKVDEAAQGSQKSRDKFKELGITLSDLGKLSEEDLLRKTIEGLSKIEDPIRRNALAFDILGKGIKGVDLKSFNNDLDKVKGSYDNAEESFARIQAWGDKIAKSWFDAKVAMANYIVQLADSVNKNKELMANRNEYAKSFYGGADYGKSGVAGAPIDTTGHPDFGTAKPASGRATPISDEQQKVLDKIKAQREALNQNILTITRQTDELHGTKSMAEQIAQEFEKGGKYVMLANSPLKQQLLELAKTYDKEKERVDLQKEAIQLALMKNQHDMDFRKKLEDMSTAKERLDLERSMAGASDTQKQKMLEIFDLEKEIVALKRDDKLVTDEQIEEYRRLGMERIDAEEQNRRAQQTFQAGWSRAWENYKEKAMDSAAIAEQAFNNMASSMESALDNFVKTGKLSFSDLASSIIQDLIRIQLKAQMSSLFGGIFGGGGLGNIFTTSSTNFGNGGGILGFLGFADGGDPPTGRPSIVGERGPELFVPKTAGTIIPNNQLSSALGNQPQIVYNGPYIERMEAMDTQSATQFLSKNKSAVFAANLSAQRSVPMSR